MAKIDYSTLLEAEKATPGMIYQKLIDVMRDCPSIRKDSKNQQQGFQYRGVDAVMNVLNPLFRKHGVFVVPTVINSLREERQTKSGGNLIYTTLDVEYRFYAEDGSYVTACVHGEGMDSADKSSNKAMSIAFKYACFQVLCIPTEDFIDPDSETLEATKKATAPTPIAPPAATTTDALTCSECGNPIKGVKFPGGTTKSADEVSTATNGKCITCHNTGKIIGKTTATATT